MRNWSTPRGIAVLVFILAGLAALRGVGGTAQPQADAQSGAQEPAKHHRWAKTIPGRDGNIFYVDLDSITLAPDKRTVSALVHMSISPGAPFHSEKDAMFRFDCGAPNGYFVGAQHYMINGMGPFPFSPEPLSSEVLVAERTCSVARCMTETEIRKRYPKLFASGSCTDGIPTYSEAR
jgi:hypothetical protein